MNEKKDNSAGVWIAGVAGAILLYMLSVGLVAHYCKANHQRFPEWAETVYLPIRFLVEHSKIAERFYVTYFKLLGLD